ncbi:hypothetical protein AN396_08570 [Candidatus Epulonipiscium fishelsonii]|uniref:Uncharacterized protein n=1 Tax=Candidatus Epulonipiscium fishelsonii TaxID=77094 RepID=A0ACC8XAQ3_9FIRM|nr:hypothetical protein AN396_08570 [Epulopiscium sp. SCG-B11WGA-EpuloA1]
MKNKNIIFSIICLVIITVLLAIPTGFERDIYVNAEHAKVKILDVNNSKINVMGFIRQGEQTAQVEVMNGSFKGEILEGHNMFRGSLSSDKVFANGDIALALIEKNSNDEPIFVNLVDFYRINIELILAGIFILALIIVSGTTGIRTIISFVFTLTCIFKLFIPMLLKGYQPIMLALAIGVSISVVTLILVGGFTRKAYCAIIGAVLSSLITCILAIIFGHYFNIDGTVMEWSESLLYAGFFDLNLTQIYQAGIYLSCSGAIIDLAIDISASIDELSLKKPDISRKEILLSGLTIGKSIVGTQTTTLLLAYMGSFIGIMMVYMAQGTPLLNILNTKFIASEILQTFVGCIGLVIVSPFTALTCSYIYKK